MGSGKGAPDHWVAVVKPGRILFEMAGVDQAEAVEAMRLASHKLPVATRVVVRETARRRRAMDIDKVRELTDAELEDALTRGQAGPLEARFALSTRQLKDYSTIPQTRRTIARILTVQRERSSSARRREGDHAMTGADTQQCKASARPRSAASSATRWTRRSSCPSSAWRATGCTSGSSA